MSNPIDDYLDSKDMPKTADMASFKRGVGSAIETALPAAAIGGGLAMLSGAAGKIYHAITKSRSFHSMMQANPDLEEYRQSNPEQFSLHYNSLHRLNPTFASEPIVAGTYMRQMSMNPATAGSVVVHSLGGLPRSPSPYSVQLGAKRRSDDDEQSAQIKIDPRV